MMNEVVVVVAAAAAAINATGNNSHRGVLFMLPFYITLAPVADTRALALASVSMATLRLR